MESSTRPHFSSRIATVLTMVGVAVGLGNVWRFPYQMGTFGGSAFLIVYLIFVVCFALPALMGEWALGRQTKAGPYGAFVAAFGPVGRFLGAILLVTVLVANSYYIVVVSNVTYTAGFSIVVGFRPETTGSYQAGLQNWLWQVAIAMALIGSAMWVLSRGVNKGIERISKLFVPMFGVVVLYLIVSSLALPGAWHHLTQFVRPDFSQLTLTSIFAAMGQAFFSLSLGGTFYVVYGSYLKDDHDIPRAAAVTAFGDVSAALLAALFIVPTTLLFGIDLSTGPSLIFETLPELFAQIPGGRLLGTLFLIALGFVAYLSSIAAFQVLIAALQDHVRVSLVRAVWIVGPIEAVLMLPSAIKPDLIGVLDLVFGSGMQVLGSGLTLIALTWGLGRTVTLRQVFGRATGVAPTVYYHWVRWAVPMALLIVLALYVVDVATT